MNGVLCLSESEVQGDVLFLELGAEVTDSEIFRLFFVCFLFTEEKFSRGVINIFGM